MPRFVEVLSDGLRDAAFIWLGYCIGFAFAGHAFTGQFVWSALLVAVVGWVIFTVAAFLMVRWPGFAR